MAETTFPPLDGFDPFSQQFSKNPDEILRKAHEEQPVFYYPPLECWFVTRYEDVERVFTDSRTFSSRALRSVPVPESLKGRAPEKMMDPAYVNIDPPQHTVDRKISNKGFSRPRIAALEPRLLEFASELIDRFCARGRCDFMQEFAYPMSLRAIVEVLGLPVEDMPRLRLWTEDMFAIMSAGPADAEDAPTRPMDVAEAEERYSRLAEAWDYFDEVVESRRANPGADFLTDLANATADDGSWLMSDHTIKTHLLELVAAGNDTTANLMGNMILFFDEHPAQLEEVKRDPSLWENAIEESMRRRSSGPHLLRIATKDVILSGVRIPAGSVVVVNTSGANIDPATFVEPLRFDIHRDNASDHLTFGKGRHFCLGAPLARLETRVAMREVYSRLPGLRLRPQELTYVPAMTVQQLESLMIEWDL